MNTFTRTFFGMALLVTSVTPAYALSYYNPYTQPVYSQPLYNSYAQQGSYCLYQNPYGECMVEQSISAPNYNGYYTSAPQYNTYHYSAPTTYSRNYLYYESQFSGRGQYYDNDRYDNRYDNRYDRYDRDRYDNYDYDDRRWERIKDDFFDYNY